jgi:hypothetical protein
MTTHTQGPWRATTTNGIDTKEPWMVWSDEKGAAVAHVYARSEMASGSYDEQHANARLIAAAPELLEACRAALFGANHIDCVRAMQEVVPLIRAAIAKAEGGAK